jgi:tetratricopeptide (TPR) repeat protein
MGWAVESRNERSKALEHYQRSLDVLREVGDRWQQLWPLHALGRHAWADGNSLGGRLFFEESRAIGIELGTQYAAWYPLDSLAAMLAQQGRYAEAIEVIHILEQNSSPDNGTAAARLGEVVYLQGNLDEAARLYQHSYDRFGAEGLLRGQAWPLARLGCVAYRRGDLDRSARLLEQSLDYLGPGGWWNWNHAIVLLVQGDIARVSGQYAAAGEHYTRSLKLIAVEPNNVPDRLEAFAKLAGAAQQPQRAARLFGAASAMRQRLIVPIPPVEQADYGAALAQVRAQLDPHAFSAAWAEGAAMSEEQAVALALEDSPAQNTDPTGH